MASNHVMTGAVIGSVVVNPVLALPVAVMAHFALDALPHHGIDDHKSTKFLYVLSIDAGLAAAVLISVIILQPQNWLLIVLCGIACASPDLMWLPRWVNELRGKPAKPFGRIARFHAWVQWAERETWWGLVAEFVWFCLMFVMLSQTLKF